MTAPDNPIVPHKAELAQRAVAQHGVRSFADVGGCWGVHGGYSRALLDSNPIERAYLVDGKITPLSRERGERYAQLSYIQGMLGDPALIDSVPAVDALLMYDILLHQVDPDWDRFIALWSVKARVIIVYNQMWAQGPSTVRFVDQGADWYKKNVWATHDVDEWFARHDDIHPGMKRPWRDVHNYWQWGITRADLVGCFERLGFRLDFSEGYGQWKNMPWIQKDGFVFVRNA